MKMKTKFIDAQKMAKMHPATFEAPTKKELSKIKVGDFVKVSHNSERFWTIITKIKGENITAKVDNDLILIQPFVCGDIIQFKKRHIHSILTEGL